MTENEQSLADSSNTSKEVAPKDASYLSPLVKNVLGSIALFNTIREWVRPPSLPPYGYWVEI